MKAYKYYLLVGFVLTFLIGCFFYFSPRIGEAVGNDSLEIFHDDYEVGVYEDRGSWAITRDFPYKSQFEEYPELAVWFFGSIHLLKGPLDYMLVFYIVMGLFMFGVFWLTLVLLKHFNKSYLLAFLMFLPSSIFFVFNRFDIVPVFFVLLSLYLLFKSKYKISFLLLAIAFLLKWFAVVLVPIYICYIFFKHKKIKKTLLPILLFVLPVVAVFGTTILGAGLEAFLSPYQFHMARTCEFGNIWGTINFYFSDNFTGQNFFCSKVTTVLQLFVPLLLFIIFILKRKKLTDKDVLLWSFIMIVLFVFFSRLYSNQWLIWFSPLLILLIKDKIDVILLVAFDVINWLLFPVLPRHIPFIENNNFLFPLHVYNFLSVLLMILLITIVIKIYENNNHHPDI